MSRSVQVDVDEVRRVFELLEKMNSLFHQPMSYQDLEVVQGFADDNYAEIHDLYYEVVWGWLPDELREEILGR